MKKISIEMLRRSLGETFSRFGMTLAYCAALALFCTLMSRDLDFGQKHLNAAATVYLVTGIFVSFSIDLRRQIYGKRWMLIAAALSHILIILNAIAVAHFGQTDIRIGWNGTPHMSLTTTHFFDIAAVVSLCVISPFVRPFFRWKDDMRMWHFARKFIINYALIGIVMSALFSGVMMLVSCAGMLFNITFNKLYVDVAIWLWLFLFPTIILMRTPLLAEIQTERVKDKFSFVILRLFSILLCIYLLMLHAYILRIVFAWELPKGMVSMPVACMMILLIAVRCIAYGIDTEGKRHDAKFLKILPWLALPTLVLMSIGIGRRLLDYGMTAPRFYLILLNLWLYAAAVYLILRQRLMPILLSFIALAFLSSFGPTSAWRLFPKEDAEPENVEETKKFAQSKWFGQSYMLDGMEIALPEHARKLRVFNRGALSTELLPNASDEYLVRVIDGHPFLISRDQLLHCKDDTPLVLKTTDGQTITLTFWHVTYDTATISKSIRLHSLAGYIVE